MAKLSVTVDSGEPLDVRRFSVSEAVSGAFFVGLWVRSDNPSVDLAAIAGKPATFVADSQNPASPLGGLRHWSGVVRSMELVHSSMSPHKEQSTYRLVIVPELYPLTLRRGYRIFEDLSVPAIVEKILREWRLATAWNVDQAAYPVLEYRVQYGESDYDFVRRQLADVGIAFTFPESAGGSVLTMSDKLHADPVRAGAPIPYLDRPKPGTNDEFVTRVATAREVRPGGFAVRDYDFLRPDFTLRGEAPVAPAPEDRLEQYLYRPKGFVIAAKDASATPMADDRGTYRHDHGEGAVIAERSLAEARTGRRFLDFHLGSVDLWPGVVFTVKDHPEIADGERLLCAEISITGAASEPWTTTGRAVRADAPYRPPHRLPRPRMVGVQSATVVGPAKTEIYTDEHGRVRVEFPWDRLGKRDPQSSCWLRVAHGWAGRGFGFAMTPRVGQEVIVSFLDGDPDAPIVMGRPFNRTHPVPYKLPEKKTRSAWRSDSSIGSSGDNEIFYEDAAGAELVYMQAQKDHRKLVKNDETITDGQHRDKFVVSDEIETTAGKRVEVTQQKRVELVSGYRTTVAEANLLRLVRGDEFDRIEEEQVELTVKGRHTLVAGTRRDLVMGDEHEHVKANKNAKVGDLSRAIGADLHAKIHGDYLAKTGEAHLKTDTDLAAEAPDITVKGPGGFLRIDASGVTISGTVVKINEGGSAGSGAGAAPKKPEAPKEAIVDVPATPAPAEAGVDEAEIAHPDVHVLVSIKNENGIKGGCPFVPKDKTHTYRAVGSPPGGTYTWSVKGKAAFTKGDKTDTVEVKGNAVSGALEDSELTVTYTTKDGAASDAMKLTVFEIKKIVARLRSTPRLRDKGLANSMAAKSSARDSKVIDATALTLIRGAGDLELVADVHPAGVPISWDAERAADDVPELAGPPTHLAGGGAEKRRLHTDATGSFHVHAYMDCDGDGKRGPDETGIILNVNMVSVEVVPGVAENRQLMRNTLFSSARSTAGSLVVDSGTPMWALAAHNASYTDAAFVNHAQGARIGVKLTGGGPQQKRGLDEVGLAFIQVSSGDTFKGTYADGRTVKEVIAQSTALPFMITAGAAAMLRYPIRDTRGAGTGGVVTGIISSSDNDKTDLAPGGQKWVLRMIDSPAIVLPLAHPVTGSALASISGHNAFAIFAVAFSKDFDENFTTVATGRWRATYGTYTAAAGWTNAGALITGDRRLALFHPPKRGEDTPSLERCPPNFVDNLRLDAR